MSDLAIYHELTYIETFDGEIFTLADDYQDVRNKFKDSSKHLDVGSAILSKSMIKRIYKVNADDVDNAVLLIQDKSKRIRLQKMIEQRRNEGKRVNMQVLQNLINNYD